MDPLGYVFGSSHARNVGTAEVCFKKVLQHLQESGFKVDCGLRRGLGFRVEGLGLRV